ncbi:hypothetical protein F442_10524 [Phytophthora nicotianae P10297]|uniref:Uncharacterized protein n=1 Tax=Phytophthora nicotianae P10297 TaxID=1317064 RepID=W2Z6I9_PHYNI|nr:hypothetical protein F442_10524 [Phytophthora nicotianae P10297]
MRALPDLSIHRGYEDPADAYSIRHEEKLQLFDYYLVFFQLTLEVKLSSCAYLALNAPTVKRRTLGN